MKDQYPFRCHLKIELQRRLPRVLVSTTVLNNHFNGFIFT